MTLTVAFGLSDAEVAQRVAAGKTNDVPVRAARGAPRSSAPMCSPGSTRFSVCCSSSC